MDERKCSKLTSIEKANVVSVDDCMQQHVKTKRM